MNRNNEKKKKISYNMTKIHFNDELIVAEIEQGLVFLFFVNIEN